MNPALLLDSKLTGNLSSEMTSATGSNGSHGSPQHTLTGKGKQVGTMAAARKLFALQNAETVHSKKKDAERQPLYLQMVAARNGTQRPSTEQAEVAQSPMSGAHMADAHHENYDDLVDLELDGEQEHIWEQSMAKIIDEMRVQLQLDLSGQSTAAAEANAFEEVMDKFVESRDFQSALAYKGPKKRSHAGAKAGQEKQKAGANGGKSMR